MRQLEPTIHEISRRLDRLLDLIKETQYAVSLHSKIIKEHQKVLKAIEKLLEEGK